jgi:hypothetical protein
VLPGASVRGKLPLVIANPPPVMVAALTVTADAPVELNVSEAAFSVPT